MQYSNTLGSGLTTEPHPVLCSKDIFSLIFYFFVVFHILNLSVLKEKVLLNTKV